MAKQEDRASDTFLVWFKSYWVFILAIAAVVGYAENLRSNVEHMRERLDEQTAVVTKMVNAYELDSRQWTEYMASDLERWKNQQEMNNRISARLAEVEKRSR